MFSPSELESPQQALFVWLCICIGVCIIVLCLNTWQIVWRESPHSGGSIRHTIRRAVLVWSLVYLGQTISDVLLFWHDDLWLHVLADYAKGCFNLTVQLFLMSVIHHTASTLVQSQVLERGLDQSVRIAFLTVVAFEVPVYGMGTALRAVTNRSVLEAPNQLCMMAGAVVLNSIMWFCLSRLRSRIEVLARSTASVQMQLKQPALLRAPSSPLSVERKSVATAAASPSSPVAVRPIGIGQPVLSSPSPVPPSPSSAPASPLVVPLYRPLPGEAVTSREGSGVADAHQQLQGMLRRFQRFAIVLSLLFAALVGEEIFTCVDLFSDFDRSYIPRPVGFERKSPMKLLLLLASTWYAWIAPPEPGSRADMAAREDPEHWRTRHYRAGQNDDPNDA